MGKGERGGVVIWTWKWGGDGRGDGFGNRVRCEMRGSGVQLGWNVGCEMDWGGVWDREWGETGGVE